MKIQHKTYKKYKKYEQYNLSETYKRILIYAYNVKRMKNTKKINL